MQRTGGTAEQRIAADAVRAHLQHDAVRAVGLINKPYLLIRRILQREHASAAEKLHDEPVEIFSAGADDYLLRVGDYAAAPREVGRDRLAKLRAAAVRRAGENALAAVAQDAAHRTRKHGKREIARRVRPLLLRRGARQRRSGAAEAHIVPAALAALDITLLLKQFVRVLDRYHAHAELRRGEAL